MDISLTSQRSSGLALVPVVVVICQVELEVAVRSTNEVSLVVALIVAVAVCEVESTLEVAGSVTAGLVGLSRIGDSRLVEFAVVDPASLNRSCEIGAFLYTFHTYAVLRNVLECDISYLEALAEIGSSRFSHEVEAPAVYYGISSDTLDSNVLTGLHSCHVAVVAYRAAKVC